MKRPCLKYHAPPGARYKCSFPGCEKRYVSTDGVRKHARKRHTDWLAAVDEHSSLRDKTFESKPSTYCVMEYDDEDVSEDVDGSEDAGASWRSESVPSDNESAMPNEGASVACVPVVAREVVRAPPIGERLASIAMEMNAEAEALMSTSLPSVPDFLRMINTHSSPVLAPRVTSSDDELPNTPPNTPPRSDPEYTTPWTKGLSGPGAGPPIMPFVLDEVPSKTPAAAAAGWDRAERGALAEERGDPGTNEPEDGTLLNMAESDAFVSMLLATCA